jgi:hypothetical protein
VCRLREDATPAKEVGGHFVTACLVQTACSLIENRYLSTWGKLHPPAFSYVTQLMALLVLAAEATDRTLRFTIRRFPPDPSLAAVGTHLPVIQHFCLPGSVSLSNRWPRLYCPRSTTEAHARVPLPSTPWKSAKLHSASNGSHLSCGRKERSGGGGETSSLHCSI